MIVSGIAYWDIGLVTPALSLSFWGWAFGTAWFIIRKNIVSELGCWDTGLVTPASDLSPWSWAFGPASFLISNYKCFWSWMLGHWTCHTSVGLVILKLGLRPSFILNEKSWLSLELNVATSDLSLHHRTCHLETEPSTASFSMGNYNCFWNWMMGDGTCHLSLGLVTLKLDLSPWLTTQLLV